MPTLDAVLNELHSLSDREKGIRFEQICEWLLVSDPAFSVTRTYSWERWRERCLTHDGGRDVGKDTGIDIVAETDNGDLWAVQTKCYQEKHAVSTGDIDSFIARSATSEFSRCLLIASTNKVALIGRSKLLEARNPHASLLALEDLRALDRDDWPAVGKSTRIALRRPNIMRAHQLAAVRDVVERGFGVVPGASRTGGPGATGGPDRGQLLMACGTGKTLTGQRIAEKLRSERTLVVVPSLSLLEQTHRAWKADTTRSFDAFCFCSDESVAGSGGDDGDLDVTAVAVPVHTDPGKLAAFLAGDNHRRVVFATYQSLVRLTEVFADPGRVAPFDLIIADEAHRSAGRTGSPFGLVCDARRLPATRRLFMTATARVVTGAVDSDLVLSMDDMSRYGPVFHHLRFSDAVEQDLLCDYQVLVIAADPGEASELVASRQFVTTPEHERATADWLATQLAVARAMDRENLRRVLTFHSRVKGARAFAADLRGTVRWLGAPGGVLWTQAVSGVMSAGHRRSFLRQLERLDGCDRGVLSNARCLGEGVDVPAIDGVVFVDPRESVIDIVQAVGRTMRTSRDTGKRHGTIVLPVVLDPDADPETVLSSSAFQTVWKVLRALRSHDDRLDDELHALLRAHARALPAASTVPRVSFELPSITVDRAFADAFTVRAVDVTGDSFDRGLAELTAWTEEHGHSRAPDSHLTATGFPLGSWSSLRRKQFKDGRLSNERVASLNALGFIWDLSQHDFDRGLAELRAHVEEHGDARVLQSHKRPSGFALGSWCSRCRQQRKDGRLLAERVAALNELGFVWDALQDAFDVGLAELVAYVQEHGNARVAQDHKTRTGYPLGKWCAVRRQWHKAGNLDDERVLALDALGFVWDLDQQDFDRGLSELQAYVAQNGVSWVPHLHRTTTGFSLGSWCSHRRNEFRAGQLDAERVAELDALGFVWAPLQDAFARGLAEFTAYLEGCTDPHVPQDHKTPTGFALGKWCSVRRQWRKSGKLDDERVAALDALGFIWDPLQRDFDRGLSALDAYIAQHGNTRVPATYLTTDGFRLGPWCVRRRQELRNGRLTAEHAAALEALGFLEQL